MDKRAWQRAAAIDTDWGKARETLPGVFSDFLDRMIYDMSECTSETGNEKVAFPLRIFLGVPDVPTHIKWHGRDGDYAETVKTLREIAELLEAYAYRAKNAGSTT